MREHNHTNAPLTSILLDVITHTESCLKPLKTATYSSCETFLSKPSAIYNEGK